MTNNFQPYPKYKETGLFWLEKIPEKWDWLYLSQIATDKQVKNIENKEKLVLSLSYGKIIRKNNIDFGLVPREYSNYQVVSPGNIILRLTDLQNDKKSLRTGLVRENGIITSAYVGLKVKENHNADFIHYVLHTFDNFKVFYGMGGGVRQSIGFNDIRKLRIPTPSLEEQNQIVKYLNYKIRKIEKFIKSKKLFMSLLKEQKQAVVNEAVMKGLNPNVKTKFSGFDWIGDIPEHWEIRPLRHLLKPFSLKNRPDLPLLSVVREKGIVLRKQMSKEENHNFIPDDLSGYKVVKSGQFVMNKMKAWQGSYGVSAYEGIVSPAYYVFDLNFNNTDYFHHAIRSKVYVNFFYRASDGIRTGQWDLSLDKMREIPFFVPPAEEQKEINEYIPKEIKRIENTIYKIEDELKLVEEYRMCLISNVVTGKVNVQGINLSDIQESELQFEDKEVFDENFKSEEVEIS